VPVPVAPVSPVAPFGIVKSNVAAALLPLLATDALVPASPVVVDPTAMVAAAPSDPSTPSSPSSPVAPETRPNVNDCVGYEPVTESVGVPPAAMAVGVANVQLGRVASAPAAPVSPCGPV